MKLSIPSQSSLDDVTSDEQRLERMTIRDLLIELSAVEAEIRQAPSTCRSGSEGGWCPSESAHLDAIARLAEREVAIVRELRGRRAD